MSFYNRSIPQQQSRNAKKGRNGNGSQTPAYAIDFNVESSGQRMANTKRRIKWTFGYANREALDGGQTGVLCRGVEHEVMVVWSVTSGKRQILMDGIEIHYAGGRTDCFRYGWGTPDKRVLQINLHALRRQGHNAERQYDLWIDGQSFFDLPPLQYVGFDQPQQHQQQYGRSSNATAAKPPARAQFYGNNGLVNLEELQLQSSVEASIAESRRHLIRKPKRFQDHANQYGYR